MKKSIVFLSLLLGTVTQLQSTQGSIANLIQRFNQQHNPSNKPTITPKPKFNKPPPLVAPKPKFKKIPPLVAPKPIDKTRNLAIFLHDHTIHSSVLDAVVHDLLATLLSPSNYTVLVSSTLIQILINKYYLLQDLINTKVNNQIIVKKYKNNAMENTVFTPYLKQYFEQKPHLLKNSKVPSMNSLKDELDVLNICMHNVFNLWTIYKTKHNFHVLIPKNQKPLSYFSINKLYHPQTLAHLIKKSSPKHIDEFSSEEFLTDLRELVKGSNGSIIPRPLNVYLTGHGINATFNRIIAGLTIQSFKKFIQFLKTTNTHSLFYSTCYGGGANYVDTFDMELPYLVIAQGLSETSISNIYTDLTHLPSYFKSINTDLHKALNYLAAPTYDDDLDQDIVLNDYKIRLPKTDWFSLAEINKRVQTIGKIKAFTASLNKKPIILTDKPCGLLVTTLPPLKVPKTSELPLIIGIAPSQGIELYVFEEIIIEKDYKNIKEVIKALHSMFEQSLEVESRSYENGFYIKTLFIGNKLFQNVIIYKETILIQYSETNKSIKVLQASRNTINTDQFSLKYLEFAPSSSTTLSPEDSASQTLFNKSIKKGNKKLKTYYQKVEDFRAINRQKYPDKKSDFALLRQELITIQPKNITKSVIKGLKEEFSESDLSRSERAALESILKYRISES
jgi:hypothetical protein